jgi:hypothetical protein
MGYKVLGFVVWQGSKLYLRRRLSGPKRKIVLAGLAGLAAVAVGGVVAVGQRQQSAA